MSEPQQPMQSIPPHIAQVNRVNCAMAIIGNLVRPDKRMRDRTPAEERAYNAALQSATDFLYDTAPLEDDA